MTDLLQSASLLMLGIGLIFTTRTFRLYRERVQRLERAVKANEERVRELERQHRRLS